MDGGILVVGLGDVERSWDTIGLSRDFMAGVAQIIFYLFRTYTFLHDAIDRPNSPQTHYKHASLEKTRRTASH